MDLLRGDLFKVLMEQGKLDEERVVLKVIIPLPYSRPWITFITRLINGTYYDDISNMPFHPDIVLCDLMLCSLMTCLSPQQGITHRDIKPENLLHPGWRRLYLSDFGLSTDEARPISRSGILDYMVRLFIASEPVRQHFQRVGSVRRSVRWDDDKYHLCHWGSTVCEMSYDKKDWLSHYLENYFRAQSALAACPVLSQLLHV